MQLLYANNATSSLASGISAVATSLTLESGTGALFPSPTGNEGFFITIQDAATQLTNEIVLCTSRAGDVLTIERAQQGTAAVTWNAGDLVQQLVTEGDLENLVQPDQLQAGDYTACQGSGTNFITATLESGLTEIQDSMMFVVRAAAANTGPCNLTLTLGSTTLRAYSILKSGGAVLAANDIPAAGYPCLLIFSGLLDAYILANPSTSVVASIAGGAANELLIQTGAGATGFVDAPSVVGSVLAWSGSAVEWIAAAVTSFNGRSGAVVPQTGDYTSDQVGAAGKTWFSGGNILLANPGFQLLPGPSGAGAQPSTAGGGLYIQAGTRVVPPNSLTPITFPHAFAHGCMSVVASCNNQSAALEVDGITTASFNVRVNATQVSWIAVGW